MDWSSDRKNVLAGLNNHSQAIKTLAESGNIHLLDSSVVRLFVMALLIDAESEPERAERLAKILAGLIERQTVRNLFSARESKVLDQIPGRALTLLPPGLRQRVQRIQQGGGHQ